MSDLSLLEIIQAIIEEIEEETDWVWIDDLIYELKDRAIESEIVSTSFEDSSRWHNHYSYILKVNDNYYFQVNESKPATEYQEGEGIYEVFEVVPHTVTKIEYIQKEG